MSGRRPPPRRPVAPRRPQPEPDDEREWVDRSYADADLSNRVLRGGELRRCVFTRCRLTGLQVPEGVLSDVRFVGCRLDLAAMRFAGLERVAFEGCLLRELDLTAARLTDVRFEDCDPRLRLAEFGGARAARLELSGCEVEGLGGVDGLRGALVTWPDAVGLLGPLVAAAGLVVLDETA
ncbi:MAG: pentapeptide repeat-containing protein [Solirubrobacteraceae bacterium]